MILLIAVGLFFGIGFVHCLFEAIIYKYVKRTARKARNPSASCDCKLYL